MKITKTEKIWLICTVAFYVLYNLPFVPAYGNASATGIHALLTLVPLWLSIYVGLALVCRQKKLKATQENIEINPIETISVTELYPEREAKAC